jgi:hypothetical protein
MFQDISESVTNGHGYLHRIDLVLCPRQPVGQPLDSA